MRILIIDRDHERRKTVEVAAQTRGYDVIVCDSLDSNGEAWTESTVDVAFIAADSGKWDQCTAVRGLPGGKACLIVALADEQGAEAALTEGADDFLAIPFSDQALKLKLFGAERRAGKSQQNAARSAGAAQSIWNSLQIQEEVGLAILNSDGHIHALNAAAQGLLSGSSGDITGKDIITFMEEMPPGAAHELDLFLTGQADHYCTEALCTSPTPQKWIKVIATRIPEPPDSDSFAAVILEDITARRNLEDALHQRNLYDPLTGLPSRDLFIDRVAHAMKRNERQPQATFGLLFVDVDRFKSLNDSVGREHADQLLVDLSKRLVKSIRPGDTVCRLGGDEFTILLENIKSVADATRVSERIREELIEPTIIDGQEVMMSVSIGIATSESEYSDPEEVIRDADTAMHRAKSLGKGRHHIFDREMHTRVTTMLSLEQDLRRALDRNEFWVAYQPIIDLKSGTIHGVEALLRWNHAERGFISPGDFIPLAEECGVILSLGQWVLKESCRQAQAWHSKFSDTAPVHLSVNVSSKQFADPKLVQKVEQLLSDSGLNPKALSLEITESVVMEKSDSATDALANLQNLGIRLHMDDFGTGYSSLAYLHRFPMDALKIDRSFIMRMDQGDRTIELVRTIINLARTQRLAVVAEGVETQKHLDTLRALGCDYAQGYFFSKPVNAEGINELLASAPKW